ncbi:MAG TPA: DUF6776 family protein [Pseudoxanthomonas sp.]|nr:DUF6776 family protein [Pseudoxanthomonas sp.]
MTRSAQISRDANRELQSSLTERDEERRRARRRAFHERLVGPTQQQRKGLKVSFRIP